jgi:hypothetical protein
MVVSACWEGSEGRWSRALMRVESLARVWFMGPIAEERGVVSGVEALRIVSQDEESRKQGLCFRRESIDYGG